MGTARCVPTGFEDIGHGSSFPPPERVARDKLLVNLDQLQSISLLRCTTWGGECLCPRTSDCRRQRLYRWMRDSKHSLEFHPMEYRMPCKRYVLHHQARSLQFWFSVL